MFNLGTCRVFAEVIVAFPVARRPDGPGNKTTAAIGTDIIQHSIDACSAECTFIATDTRFG